MARIRSNRLAPAFPLVAALLAGAAANVASPVVAVVSGGNVDPETLARIL